MQSRVVARIVTIGSPHHGTTLAEVAGHYTRLSPFQSQCVREMMPGIGVHSGAECEGSQSFCAHYLDLQLE